MPVSICPTCEGPFPRFTIFSLILSVFLDNHYLRVKGLRDGVSFVEGKRI